VKRLACRTPTLTAGFPGNERSDSLAKTGATLPVTHVPCPLAPTNLKIRHTCYSLWRRNPSHNSLSYQIPSVSSEELALPRLIRCELSRLRCHGHSLLLTSYLCRLKRKNNSSCSACRHPLQNLTIFSWIVPHLSLSGASSLALLPFLTSGPDLGAWPDC